jgi:acyl-CoA hydrolase
MNDRITLRFLASPQDSAAGGTTVAAGRVLEWIDKAGYACAVGWSGSYCVTAYVGNVHFTAPITAGELVEAHARIIHTGRTSMQVLVVIEAADVQSQDYVPSTHCILVFVAVDDGGMPREVPRWTPSTDVGRILNERAEQRLAARREIRDAMMEQHYTHEGTTPRTVFRFLAAPSAANWGGNAHGGTVMGWIDEAAYACAAGWSSTAARAVYSGGIHFFRPIRIGHIVEVDARLIHAWAGRMHIAVRVRSGSPRTPEALELTTQCMSIFVDPGPDGRAQPVEPLELRSAEDHRLDRHARDLIRMRERLEALPIDTVPVDAMLIRAL